MEFIELKDVYKVYKNGVTGLAGVNLQIKKGDFVFIIGSTASGKSTLIKTLYREEKVTKGSVYVGGVNVSRLKNNKTSQNVGRRWKPSLHIWCRKSRRTKY